MNPELLQDYALISLKMEQLKRKGLLEDIISESIIEIKRLHDELYEKLIKELGY